MVNLISELYREKKSPVIIVFVEEPSGLIKKLSKTYLQLEI